MAKEKKWQELYEYRLFNRGTMEQAKRQLEIYTQLLPALFESVGLHGDLPSAAEQRFHLTASNQNYHGLLFLDAACLDCEGYAIVLHHFSVDWNYFPLPAGENAQKLFDELQKAGVPCQLDKRDERNPSVNFSTVSILFGKQNNTAAMILELSFYPERENSARTEFDNYWRLARPDAVSRSRSIPLPSS